MGKSKSKPKDSGKGKTKKSKTCPSCYRTVKYPDAARCPYCKEPLAVDKN